MIYMNLENTLWQHGDRSGSIDDPFFKQWLKDGNPVDAYVAPPVPTDDEIYDSVIQNQQVLKALVLCINDGSIVPGADVSNTALKTAIKAKM